MLKFKDKEGNLVMREDDNGKLTVLKEKLKKEMAEPTDLQEGATDDETENKPEED